MMNKKKKIVWTYVRTYIRIVWMNEWTYYVNFSYFLFFFFIKKKNDCTHIHTHTFGNTLSYLIYVWIYLRL